jgi:hypothetical protein
MNIALIILIIFVILVIAFIITLSLRKEKEKEKENENDEPVLSKCKPGEKNTKACKGIVEKEGVKDSYKECVNDVYTVNCITECNSPDSFYDSVQDKCTPNCTKNNVEACSHWSRAGVNTAYIKCEKGKYVRNPAFKDGCTVECTNPKAVPDEKNYSCKECGTNDEEPCKEWTKNKDVRDAYIKCEDGLFKRNPSFKDGCTVVCTDSNSYPVESLKNCVSFNKQVTCNPNTYTVIEKPLSFINYVKNKVDDKYFIGKDVNGIIVPFQCSDDNILNQKDWGKVENLPLTDTLSSFIFKDITNKVGYYLMNNKIYNRAGAFITPVNFDGFEGIPDLKILDLKSYYDNETFYIFILVAFPSENEVNKTDVDKLDKKVFIYADNNNPLNRTLITSYDLGADMPIKKLIPINVNSFYILLKDGKLKLFNGLNKTITDVVVPENLTDLTFNYTSKKFIFSYTYYPPPLADIGRYNFSGTYTLMKRLVDLEEYDVPEKIILNEITANSGTVIMDKIMDATDYVTGDCINCWDKKENVEYLRNFKYFSVNKTQINVLSIGLKDGRPFMLYYVENLDKYLGYYVREETPTSEIRLCSS